MPTPSHAMRAAVGRIGTAAPGRTSTCLQIQLASAVSTSTAAGGEQPRATIDSPYVARPTEHEFEELHQTEERLQAVIESAPVGILEVDLESRVIRWNPAAER